MIELSRHIEALLLENDCVIIPGFGGFVAHGMKAVHLPEEARFMPPTRVVGFNPQLQLNDGLLVQSFMSVYGNSFPDATRMVEKKVKLLQKQLNEEGRVELPNIGELSLSLRGSYVFQPYDHRLTTPALYGLDEFVMKELPPRATRPLKPVKPVLAPTLHRHRPAWTASHYRRLRRGAAHVTVCIIMLLLVCLSFYISTPIRNTDILQENQATLSPAAWVSKLGSESLAITPIVTSTPIGENRKTTASSPTTTTLSKRTVKTESAPPAQPQVARTVERTQVAASQAATPTPTAVPTSPKSPRWHLIVASMATEKDARALAEKLVQEGHKEAQAVIGDGKMRVSLASYATEAAAYKALGELRKEPAYQTAWVLKRK